MKFVGVDISRLRQLLKNFLHQSIHLRNVIEKDRFPKIVSFCWKINGSCIIVKHSIVTRIILAIVNSNVDKFILQP